MLASGVPYAEDAWAGSHARIEAFAHDWGQAWTTACIGRERTPDPSDAPRLACLSARLDELDARLDVLEGAERTTVENAVVTIAGLESPHGCLELRDAEGLPTPGPEIASEVDAVQSHDRTLPGPRGCRRLRRRDRGG